MENAVVMYVFSWSSGQWSSPDSNRVQVTNITAWTNFLIVILRHCIIVIWILCTLC